MKNKKAPQYILTLLIIGLIFIVSVGLSIWIITDTIKVKPNENDQTNQIIIEYLDGQEGTYNGNILLPSYSSLGLDISSTRLKYYYKIKNSSDDFVEVDISNQDSPVGPIDVNDYLIRIESTDSDKTISTDSFEFQILPRSIDEASISFNQTAGNVFNLGVTSSQIASSLDVTITIKNSDNTTNTLTLKRGIDFSVSVPSLTIGDFQGTISAIADGNYTGSKNFDYIIQDSLAINVSTEFDNYDSSNDIYYFTYKKYTEDSFPVNEWVTVTSGSSVVDATINYEYKSTSDGSYTALGTHPLDCKEYTLKITATVDGSSPITKEITLEIRQADISNAIITLTQNEYTYNGNAHTPEIVSVILNGDTLVAGEDYTLAYSNNIDANVSVVGETKVSTTKKASVIISGNVNYIKSTSKDFDILQAPTSLTAPTYSLSGYLEGTEPVESSPAAATALLIKSELVSETVGVDGTIRSNAKTVVFPEGEQATQTVTIKYDFIPSDSNSNGISNFQTTSTTANFTMFAVAYIGNTYYGKVSTAVSKAVSGNTVYVIPNLKGAEGNENLYEIVVNESINISNRITLCLPYSEKNVKTSGVDFSTIGNTIADSTEALISTNRTILLSLRNGADITIETGGSLQIGGVFNKKGIVGSYAELNLGENSSIIVSGTLTCYGYIKEDYNNASNSESSNNILRDNSNDENRFLKVFSSGTIYTVLAVNDSAGGSALTSLNEAGTCPVAENDLPAIQTYAIYDHGCSVITYVRMSAAGNDLEREIAIIKPSTYSNASLFYQQSGSIVMEYIPINAKLTSVGAKKDKTYIIIKPDSVVNMGYLNIDASITKIDTRNMFCPISYKFHLFIQNNASFISSYKIKVMPGSKIEIDENGILTLDSSLIVYKISDMAIVDSSDGINYPKNNDDGVLINNGSIVLTANGKLGGYIQHTNINNTATINLTNVSKSALTVTSPEGTNKTEIIVSATGDFLSGDVIINRPFDEKQVVTSVYDSEYYWDGKYLSQVGLEVIIEDLGYRFPVYSYTIYGSTTGSDTDQFNISSTDATGNLTKSIDLDTYVKFVVNRAASYKIDLNDGKGYVDVEDKWYLITKDMKLLITPNEGVKITIKTSGNSGAGKVNYTVYESTDGKATSDNTKVWTAVGTTTLGSLTTYVIAGAQFKFTTKSDYGYYFTTKPYYSYTYNDANQIVKVAEGVHGTENSSSSSATALGNNIVYDGSYNYQFSFGWNFTCVAAGTFVTMADGTQKRVEDIKMGDTVLVFNHETGNIEPMIIMYNAHDDIEWTYYNVINLEFSDGTILKVINEHAAFNTTLNRYVFFNEKTMNDFIGHTFYKMAVVNGEYIRNDITLVKSYVTYEYTGIYNPITYYHLNFFGNGLLTTAGGIEKLINNFEYDHDLSYNEDSYRENIEKYGIYTYEELSEYYSEEVFKSIPIQYVKIAVGKGIITWEEARRIIDGQVKPIEEYLNKNNKTE